MLKHLLDHIMSSNTYLNTEVNICRSLHSYKFVKAYNYLYIVVVRLYPYANLSPGHFRKRSIFAAGRGYCGGRRGGCFNGRSHCRGRVGRGGQGRKGNSQGGCVGGGSTHENGIDISDVTSYFEDSEWAAISNDTSKRITEYMIHI